MFMFGNFAGTSRELRQHCSQKFNLLSKIEAILFGQKGYPKALTQNMLWIVTSYSKDGGSLKLSQIETLTNICEYLLPMFNQDVEDEETMIEII